MNTQQLFQKADEVQSGKPFGSINLSRIAIGIALWSFGSAVWGGAAPIITTLQTFNGIDSGTSGPMVVTSSGKYLGAITLDTPGSAVSTSELFEYDPALKTVTNIPDAQKLFFEAYGLINGSDGCIYTVNGADLIKFDPLTQATSVVHQFTPGSLPGYPITQGSDGNLYGINALGGQYNKGEIYTYNLISGSFNVVYSFGGDSSGVIDPISSLVQASDGNFYGVSGSVDILGSTSSTPTSIIPGTIYEWNPITHQLLSLYSSNSLYPGGSTYVVNGSTDSLYGSNLGANGSSLLQAADGKLYGLNNNETYTISTNNSGYTYTPIQQNNSLFSFDIKSHTFSTVYTYVPTTEVSPTIIFASDAGIYSYSYEESHLDQSGTVLDETINPTLFRYDPASGQTTTTSINADLVGNLFQGTDGNFYDTTLSDTASTLVQINLGLPPVPFAPSNSLTLTASPGNQSVTLNWTSVAGATGYNIYMGTVSGSEGVTPVQANVLGTTQTIAGLTNGVTYYFTVQAMDSGSTSYISNESGARPEPILGNHVEFQNGLQMISMPYSYFSDSLDSIFGYTGVTLAAWQPSMLTYAVTPTVPSDTMSLGQGYWVRFPSMVDAAVGIPASTATNFDIPLSTGWNMIGDPFVQPVNLSSTLYANGSETFANASAGLTPLIGSVVFTYGPTTGGVYKQSTTMEPYVGYWIYASQNTDMQIPSPTP